MIEDNKIRSILQKVRTIELRTRVAMTDSLAGSYHSIFKGQGVNFEEIREYTPGDEVRFIDWNASAKLGHPFIKIFREERELTLILAIDVSGSSLCGTEQAKREFATEIASLLAFSALKNNDKVGLFLFSDNVEKFIPPQKGRQQLLRVIREALFFQPKSENTDIKQSIEALGQMLKKKAIICLISDFISPVSAIENDTIQALSQLNQHHDLLCIRIEDPRERTLPDVGFIALEDAETHQQCYLDTHNPKIRLDFEKQQKKYWDAFQSLCLKRGLEILSLTNGQPYSNALKMLFKHRHKHS